MARFETFLNHAHVFPAELYPEGSLERLAGVLEQSGIDRAVCFAPIPIPLEAHAIKENPRLASVADIDGSRWLAQELRNYPRFVGFGVIDFRRNDPADQVRRIVDLGLRGIKLHPAAQEFDVLSEPAFQVYEEAQRQGLPIAIHTGAHGYRLSSYTDPLVYDELSHRFPELRLILEHIGRWHYYRPMTGVIYNANRRAGKGEMRLYAGFTRVFGIMGPDGGVRRADLADATEVERVLEWIGEDAAILGMDFPWAVLQQHTYDIDTVCRLSISDEAKGKILGGNLTRLLGLAS